MRMTYANLPTLRVGFTGGGWAVRWAVVFGAAFALVAMPVGGVVRR